MLQLKTSESAIDGGATNTLVQLLIRSVVILCLLNVSHAAQAFTQCDVNQDQAIDKKDLRLIRQRVGERVAGSGDLADADGDGRITAKDVRSCRKQCTRAGCAVGPRRANTRPVAFAGEDQTVTTGSLVVLDGAGSTDADGDVLSYQWKFTGKPGRSRTTLNNSHAINPSFVADRRGVYKVRLIVSDSLRRSVPDFIRIRVVDGDVAVPDVRGELLADAELLLQQADLVVGSITRMPSATVVAGAVIDQAPGAGTSVAEGSAVDLLISTGTSNAPPVADAGSDQSVALGSVVVLDASASTDPDGDALTYSWNLQTPDNSQTTLDDSASIRPAFTADVPGSYTATLTVFDTTGQSSDEVTVNTTNSAPVADAGADQSATVGTTVTLDGSASSDVDGDELSWFWTIESAPEDSSATLSDVTAVLPSITLDVPGSWVVALVVSDGVLESTIDTVTLSTSNSLPVANAGPDQSAITGQLVVLDGSASGDVDGDPLTFRWAFVSRPAGSGATLSDALAVMPRFTVDVPGSFVIQLIVNDDQADSVADIVNVQIGNSAPVADAGANQTAAVGSTVTLDGTNSSDVDGDPLTFSWSVLGAPVGSGAVLSSSVDPQPTFVIDRSGTYTLQLVVNDGTLDSQPVSVVVSTSNTAPVADAGIDQSVGLGDAVMLDGSGSSDVDGDPLEYRWSLEAVPLGSSAQLSDPTAVNPLITIDAAGTFLAQLIVNDGTLDSLPATITITTINTLPVAAIQVTGEPALVGDTLTFSGQPSSDADGDPLTYAWSLLSRPEASVGTLDVASGLEARLLLDVPGDYVVQLIVNDGAVDSAPVSVVVSTGNSRPIADAGSDSSGLVGDVITFDGSASSDPDSDGLIYSWSLLNQPAQSTALLSDKSAVSPTLTADAAGTYVAQLIVNDGSLDSAPATSMAVITALPLLAVEDVEIAEGNSGTSLVDFVVSLSGPIDESVVVEYATLDGSAIAGEDYTSASGSLSFVPGEIEKVVQVSITGDTEFETDERFELTLNNAERAIIDVGTAAATITNDDIVGTLTLTPVSVELLTFETRTLTLTTSVPAPAGGQVLTLTSSADTGLIFPASVTLTEGASSVTIDITAASEAVETNIMASGVGYEDVLTSVVVNQRGLTLNLDQPLVGVNETSGGSVTLAEPAPSGGAIVSLAVADAGVVSAAPNEVLIGEGETTAEFVLSGVTAGTSTLTASAAGYVEASIGVESTLLIVSVAETIEIPLQRSIDYPVSIFPDPAPAGGVAIALSSSNPDVVISPTTLIIPEGAMSANAQVLANSFTAAEIQASTTGYAGDSGRVDAVAQLQFADTSVAFTDGFDTSFDLNLIAGGASAVAPPGGLVVTLTSSDPACVVPPASVTINEGLSGIDGELTYGGTAALPCTAEVSAASIAQVTGDSLSATVNPAQPIALANVRDVGKNLQYASRAASATLSERFHGGVTVRIETQTPDKVLIAQDRAVQGLSVQEVFLADGQNRVFFYLQGLPHTNLDTAATIAVSAPGFATASAVLNVVDPVMSLSNLPSTITVFGGDRSGLVRPGVAIGASVEPQSVRPGADPVTATVTISDASIVTLIDGGAPVATLTRSIAEGSSASTTFQARALDVGSAALELTAPGFVAGSFAVSGVGPQNQFSLGTPYVGENLRSRGVQRLFLGASNHGGVVARIESADPAVALLSTDPGAVGSAVIDVSVPDGQQVAQFYVHGVAVGSTSLSSSVPGFQGDSAGVETREVRLRINGLTSSIDTLDANDPFVVAVGAVNGAGIAEQPVRAGGSAIAVAVSSSDAAVALLTSGGNSGASLALAIAPNTSSVALELAPVSTGTSTISASGADVQPAPPVPVTVTSPVATFFATPGSIFAGLQQRSFGSNRIQVRLSSGGHGGVTATLTSSDPSVLRLASDNTSAGTAQINLTFAPGATSAEYVLHGIAPGVATLSAAIPGFTAPTDRSISVDTGELILSGLSASIDTLDVDRTFTVRLPGPVRVGGGPVVLNVSNLQPAIGTLVVDGVAAQNQTIEIAEGQTSTPSGGTAPVGGVQFRPQATGTTTVSVSAAGFSPANQDVLVTAPTISVSNARVGVFLRNSQSYRLDLSAGDHGGITATMCSTAPGIALVALEANDIGAECVDVVFEQGDTVAGYYVHGVAAGSANLQVSAPGFLQGSAQASVVTGAVRMSGLATSVPQSGSDDEFAVSVGVLSTSGTSFSQQPVNATAGGVIATVTSSNPGVGVLATSVTSGGTLPVTIPAGLGSSPFGLAAGGVVFRPISAGQTAISASAPGYQQATGAVSVVTVTP